MKKITLLIVAIILASSFAKALPPVAIATWSNDYIKINVNGAGTVAPIGWYWIGTDPSYATQLQSAVLGTVSSLVIEGCDMKYSSSAQDRTGGSFFYKIMSSDGLTEVVASVETIWDQTALGGNDYQGLKSTTINVLSGLKPATSYQLHVWAKSWGTSIGDSWLSNTGANYVATFTTPAIMITGANGIVDGTGYATLKDAFAAINAQGDQTGKDIEIKIGTSTTETATAVLTQPSTANWNSLTIYPTAMNVTVGGNITDNLLDLNGADYVTITGKLNKTGAAKNLTISNTENTNNSSRTVRIWNDASNNNINNCIVRGSCISSGAGVIFLGDAKTAGTGNDNNTIEYCDINAAGAANGIKATSTIAVSSDGNMIKNNNIFDFYISSTSTTATAGIDVSTNYTTSTITGNSLYQTASREYSSTAAIHLGINVGGTSNGNTISDNYIGGSAPQCGGASAWIVTGGLYRLFAIQTSLGITTASSVQNNTIANIDITSAFVTGGSSVFTGIQHSAGTVNYGNLTGNIIGSTTTNGSIKVKLTGLTVGSLVVGINVGSTNTGPLLISNNKIGGIILDLNNTTNRAHLYGISTAGSFSVTITKNTIGSENTANSFEHKGCTPTATTNLRGITVGNTGGSIIDENIIANLTSNSNGAFMTLNGIFTNSGANSQSISKNTIRNLTNYGTRASTGTLASLIALCVNTAASSNGANSIANNNIYTLNNATTTADGVEAYGIYFETSSTGSATVENNKVYDIKTSSTSTNANIIGLYIGNGLTTTKNNMISLGNGLTTAYNMSGIRKSNTKANNFYHNTVVLSGTEVGVAGTTNTYAFYKTGSGTDIIKNNILINRRSNAAGNTQKHYAISIDGITTLTSDNNLLYVNGLGGLLGLNATTDCADLAAWKTSTSLDAASKSKSVEFTSGTNLSITGTSVNDVELGAPRLATVLTDIIAASRATTTYMGAHEASDLTIPAPTKAFTVTVPNGTAKVYVAGTFTGKNWDITNPHELTATANPNEFTGTFACANDVVYKYLCEKSDWDYQEAIYQGAGNPITLVTNRTYNAADVVPIWYRVKSVKLNVSFATSAVPTQLFVKGGWDSWATPIELTKSGSTFSTTISGVLSDKIPANTQYKFYTNDMNTDNWEANADGSLKDNRWSIAPVMNDEIARFTTQIITKLDNATNNARIIRTVSGIEVQLNGLSTIELLNVNGVLIDKTISNSTYSHKLDNGIYILKINGLATKFIK